MAIDLSSHWRPVRSDGLPFVFTGGWVGYTGYDTVRYVYSGEWLPGGWRAAGRLAVQDGRMDIQWLVSCVHGDCP